MLDGPLDPVADLDQLLGGLHEWRDVQGVVRTIFQALCDVAHAQTHAVREVERRMGEVQSEQNTSLSRKADLSELRAAAAAAGDARAAADLASQRIEEEAQAALEAQRSISEEIQALRTGCGELRASLERQRADVQQWRAGVEAGLSRIVSECASDVEAAQAQLKADLQQQSQELGSQIQKEVQQLALQLGKAKEELQLALEEKATIIQLKEIVREAWTREEGHIARLHRLCESKVSASDFASLAAVAEGKASLADVDAAVQRQVQRRFQSLIADQQLLNRSDAMGLAEAAVADAKERLRECERKSEELLRRQQRTASVSEELRLEMKNLGATKLERAEAEALVAGALADWVRAAQRGADAVQAAVSRGRSHREDASSILEQTFDSSFFAHTVTELEPTVANRSYHRPYEASSEEVLRGPPSTNLDTTGGGAPRASGVSSRWQHHSASGARGSKAPPRTASAAGLASGETLQQLRKARPASVTRSRARSAERVNGMYRS
eukprot:TRINITY_DN27607_c0_g1_i1.p1 TRINITY_DN27607_c0_g1~~TRINITY_DN27607_c0_g1_i1.p1  ORF type:complete len:499 (+),score=139.56 TRINITY_DN27607_c0_g1_i1:68-1564(+)